MSKKTPRPTLAVIVRGGGVQSIVSDRPDLLESVFQDVIVLDYDYADGQIVIDQQGREDMALVSRETIQRSYLDLAEVIRELKRAVRDGQRS